MPGNLFSGPTGAPIETRKHLLKGDGTTPGHRRIVARGQEVAIPDHSHLPDPPEHGWDGKPLHDEAVAVYDRIWRVAPWLWPDVDQWWVTEIALMEHQHIENCRIIESQGVMVRGDKGNMVVHGLRGENLAIRRAIADHYRRNGFDAAGRARLAIAQVKVQTGLKDLQAKSRGNGAS